jgi:hypothetical protein
MSLNERICSMLNSFAWWTQKELTKLGYAEMQIVEASEAFFSNSDHSAVVQGEGWLVSFVFNPMRPYQPIRATVKVEGQEPIDLDYGPSDKEDGIIRDVRNKVVKLNPIELPSDLPESIRHPQDGKVREVMSYIPSDEVKVFAEAGRTGELLEYTRGPVTELARLLLHGPPPGRTGGIPKGGAAFQFRLDVREDRSLLFGGPFMTPAQFLFWYWQSSQGEEE